MKCDDYELQTCRDKIFNGLCKIWMDTKQSNDPATQKAWNGDIWRKGNTLQAVAQYWATATDAQKPTALGLMQDGYDFYSKRKGDNWWVDDFGWWGGFFSDLYHYCVESGDFPPPFSGDNLVTEIKYCYARMLENLDPVQGGIWNQKGADGQKNTITNSWMLNLAASLYNLTGGDQDYKNMAEAQYKWLTTGQYGNYSPPSWFLYASNGLLLWLPGITNSSQYWSGDEGVFLRGLIPYINSIISDPDMKKVLLLNSKNLINAAITTPNGFPDTQSVMHESTNPPDWSNDLATGKGVFMRLVTRFACYNYFFGDNSFGETFKAFVDSTAESVWCSRVTTTDTTATTAPNWNPGFGPPQESPQPPPSGELWPQVFQTNGLDALNAAVQIRAVA
jgi:hypothetical protein